MVAIRRRTAHSGGEKCPLSMAPRMHTMGEEPPAIGAPRAQSSGKRSMATGWDGRADVAVQVTRRSPTEAPQWVLVGLVGERRVGLPLSAVERVLPMVALAPLPDAPA